MNRGLRANVSYVRSKRDSVATEPTWHDFMDVFATYRASKNWHPDLAMFYQRRYDVYCELVGVDPSRTNDLDDDPKPLHWLLCLFADDYHSLTSPFAGMLEAPESVIEVWAEHNSAINETLNKQKQNYLDVMADCATRLWGACARDVTDQQLHQHGVGKSDEPDFSDYF
jgi:hypothetical protein